MGSITPYDTTAGKRYRVRYRKPDHSQTDKRGFKTKREAQLFLASIDVSKSRGEYIDAATSRITIDELGKSWLAGQTHLKSSSYAPVEIAWRVHVAPTWGNRAIGEIRHSEVQQWVSAITTNRSATTVIRSYGVLAGILDTAVKDKRLLSNPARGVNLPRKSSKKRLYLTHTQVELLASNAKDKETLIRFMTYTGLRWGEARALRLTNVDLNRRRVNIEENAVTVGGKIVVGTPKSHVTRSVPFPTFLGDELSILSKDKKPEDLLFGDGFNYLRTPSTRDGWFAQAKRRAVAIDASFPNVTIHDLRHTAASLAISAGANVKAVQRMLGHASAAMTLDTYADLFDSDLDAVAFALDDARTKSIVGKMWATTSSISVQ